MNISYVPRRLHTACLAGALMALVQPAAAQSVEDFYKGRQMTLIASGSVGGGYDLYARHLSRHIVNHIPGKPSLLVRNMVGAAGVIAANHLFNVAAQDGSVVGQVQRNVAFMPLLGAPASKKKKKKATPLKFDGRKFHWIGTPQQELGLMLVATKTGVKSLDDLKKKELTTSSTGRGAATSIYPRIMNEVFGTKFRVIEGYGGSQESLLALEKGEVDAHVSGGSSPNFRNRFAPWVKDGKVVVLLQMGLEKDPAFPDAPLVVDLPMKDEDKQLFELVFAEQIMGRPFLAPPKVPADRVKALRDAFDATMKDKAYLADAAKQKLEINPVRGERINQLLDAVYSRPKVLLDRMRQAVQ
jgi:tripartite-type tricarboxylate transporter receptor subunit TctC